MPKNAFRPAQRRRVSHVTPEKALAAHAGYATPGFAAPKLHASCDRPSRFTLRGGAASPSTIAAPRLFSQAAANAAWCSCGSSCGTAKDGGAGSERARHRVLPFRRYGLLTWQSGRHRRRFGAALGQPTTRHTWHSCAPGRPERVRSPSSSLHGLSGEARVACARCTRQLQPRHAPPRCCASARLAVRRCHAAAALRAASAYHT